MDTILASIRRILNEDELSPAEAAPERGEARDPAAGGGRDDVFVLRDSMMVQPEKIEPVLPAPAMPPAAGPKQAATEPPGIDPGLVAARTRAATEQSFEALHEALRREQPAEAVAPSVASPSLLRGGGPSLEELVREELRGLLSTWLDVHLPTLVETLVRSEIAKLTRRG